jgi:hypothetical protein
MPIHDWKQVEPTIYQHFHQRWTVAIADTLNAGLLPSGLSALIEQHSGGVVPDVLTVERNQRNRPPSGSTTTLPQTRWHVRRQAEGLLRRANRIAIRHRLGEVVCIIEIVSPGNKASRSAIRQFVEKTVQFLLSGVNVLLVDPFPPTPRDPHSLHKLIWDEIEETPFTWNAEPLLLASYRTGNDSIGLEAEAFLEAVRVGAVIPDMPAFLDPDLFVNVPLESTYQQAWTVCPVDYRYLVEHGRLPDDPPNT